LLRNTPTLGQLQHEAHSGQFDVVVLDPLDQALRNTCTGTTASTFVCLHRALCLPVVLFTPLTTEALDAVVGIAHHCRLSVMYRVSNDRVDGAAAVIERASAARLGVRVLYAMEHRARGRLSNQVAVTVEHLFHEPSAFQRVDQALVDHGITRAIMKADLERAGLQPLHVLRRVARVAHAYHLVAEFDASLKDVARRVGAGSVDSLSRETKRLTKLTPGQMCARLRPDELAEIAVRAVCPARRAR
jgi:hypothetical protein